MNHHLAMPLWEQPDERRMKSALAADLTPLTIDTDSGEASFAGTRDVYVADLERCNCLDFNINQARSSPCKHMIRLAMELNLLPSEGKKDDIQAARYKMHLTNIKQMASNGDLLHAALFGAFLSKLYAGDKVEVMDTEALDASPAKFFFELKGKIAKPIKTRKKDALALVSIIESRLGSWLLNTPDALKSAFAGYERENHEPEVFDITIDV